MPPNTTDLSDADERPSKTLLKKQAHELQRLGEALAALPDDRLAGVPMPEALLEALRETRRIRSHEGRRRHLQYVGKLMRRTDTEPLREAVAAAQLGSAQSTLELHRLEQWRLELVNDDEALTRWMAESPGTDLQHLRSLIRAARKEAVLPPEQRHGKAWRELFQFVKTQRSAQDD
ncbi:ribosome biogenesis factor YjgA [Aquincola sp. MAHUQ-54]|uniref:Dual-action ribosomal maturation protein DarP n=1 Tax=Aquincola agrisoli TaxID=3119538 RepID=A0AAW9Q8L1_9BURK